MWEVVRASTQRLDKCQTCQFPTVFALVCVCASRHYFVPQSSNTLCAYQSRVRILPCLNFVEQVSEISWSKSPKWGRHGRSHPTWETVCFPLFWLVLLRPVCDETSPIFRIRNVSMASAVILNKQTCTIACTIMLPSCPNRAFTEGTRCPHRSCGGGEGVPQRSSWFCRLRSVGHNKRNSCSDGPFGTIGLSSSTSNR